MVALFLNPLSLVYGSKKVELGWRRDDDKLRKLFNGWLARVWSHVVPCGSSKSVRPRRPCTTRVGFLPLLPPSLLDLPCSGLERQGVIADDT